MKLTLPENLDLNNPEFQNVWSLIQHTRHSVFLTGKAGTGKSTFLKYICAHTQKKYVVLAPTGIAAVNVGGQTLHSFFKIPFKPLLPIDPDFSQRRIRNTLRYTKDRVKLIKELELIIIDEISMVRADIIDFIDKVLRIFSGNMREPFGGKQLLFVGDIFQLEPVVTRDMREILSRFYKQFFFFNANVFNQLGLIPIELKKIYRQNDGAFISMLDRIRIGRPDRLDMCGLNGRCNPTHPSSNEFSITLATRRDTVDSINDEHMAALKSQEYVFSGEIKGTFPENDLPTSKELVLKCGAQVIFIRNDKEGRWINGTIGKISSLDTNVKVELEDGSVYAVEPDIWENIQYSYDEEKKVVVENILGTFVQFPIKPAWALTVHKSQGLTFNNVIIDFAGGAFTSGQTYVALSRCTSLEGITLLKPLSERDIIVNPAVISFSYTFNNQSAVDDAIKYEKSLELYRQANQAFENGEFATAVQCFVEANNIRDMLHSPAVQRLISKKLNSSNRRLAEIDKLKETIEYQRNMLKSLAQEYVEMGNQSMSYAGIAEEPSTGYGKKKAVDDVCVKSAMANFEKALRICPDCYDAIVGKGRLLFAMKRRDEAVEEFNKALEINSECFEACLGLGAVYRKLKDLEAAIKYYKRAARIDMKKIEPHQALYEIYDILERDDEADDEMAIIVKLKEEERKKKLRAQKKNKNKPK